MNTQTYAALAADILEGNKPPPPGWRETYKRTKVWLWLLEELNVADVEQKPPEPFRSEVLELGKVYDLELGQHVAGAPGRESDRDSVQLLNLVFAIQAKILVAAGYVDPEEVVEEG